MNAESLRASILQEAIQGRLVPQLESEPAVEQIGKAPEDVPFAIPEKWKWCNFGDVVAYGKCEQVQPQNIEKSAWILDLEDIESGTGNLLQKKKGISAQSNKSRFRKGDVLYSKLRPYLNKVIVADDDGYCTTEIVPISPSVAQAPLDAQYLKIYLMSPYFVGYANQCSYGVKMPRLGTKDAQKALFPLPPLKEQYRIVAKLNELRPLVETYGKEQEALEKLEKEFPDKLRASLLQEAIQGKLVPQLESEPAVEQIGKAPEDVPFAIPEKWKWCNFGNVVAYGKCEQVLSQNIEKSAWILDLEDIESGTGNLLQKKKDASVQSNKNRFKKGDVLYSKLRPYLNKVIVADEDGYCTTEIVPITPSVAQAPLDAQYLKIYLMSPYFVGYANQCSYGVKMPRLGTKDAQKALFPIPPIEEQCRIVAKLNELLSYVRKIGSPVSTP